MRKITLFIAMSLDGYIADKRGNGILITRLQQNSHQMNGYTKIWRATS